MKSASPEAVKLLHDGSLALADVEAAGIRIDVGYLNTVTEKVGQWIADLETELKSGKVWREWRKRFPSPSVGSRQQLGTVLFDCLKVPYPWKDEEGGRTASGRYRADDETLTATGSKFAANFLKLEKLRKLHSTYLVGLQREVIDGFVHPSTSLNTVSTYRSSASSPNYQNQYNRDPENAAIIRKAFIPRKGCLLVEVDYSQLEWKIAACKWRDAGMIAYASDPSKDVHRDMAVKLFRLKKEQVERKTTRDWSKNRFVFPVLYGSYWANCANHIWEAVDKGGKLADGTTVKAWLKNKGIGTKPSYEHHVKRVEEVFMAQFPTFAERKERWWRDYARRGWFRMLTGFVCSGVFSRNFLMNADIQGPGFHCLLWSLIRIHRTLKKKRLRSLIIGEIHDCILFDVPEDELQDLLTLAKRVMTEDLRRHWPWVCVPMDVEADVAIENWHAKRPWIVRGGVWGLKEKS